jgi:hypothetical protein
MRHILATLAVVGALLFSAGSAWADFDDGVAAYERGDFATAVQEFRPLAEQGVAEAQFILGLIYAIGSGIPKDKAEAFKWYRKAAEQGFAMAQYNLGRMYQRGDGVPKNDAEAVKWYRKAAEQGHAEAQVYLGVSYVQGEGVPEDYVKAHMWLSFAKAQGNKFGAELLDIIKPAMPPAQIAKAQALAAEWYRKAAEQGVA